jgi:hypothetical protein
LHPGPHSSREHRGLSGDSLSFSLTTGGEVSRYVGESDDVARLGTDRAMVTERAERACTNRSRICLSAEVKP